MQTPRALRRLRTPSAVCKSPPTAYQPRLGKAFVCMLPEPRDVTLKRELGWVDTTPRLLWLIDGNCLSSYSTYLLLLLHIPIILEFSIKDCLIHQSHTFNNPPACYPINNPLFTQATYPFMPACHKPRYTFPPPTLPPLLAEIPH